MHRVAWSKYFAVIITILFILPALIASFQSTPSSSTSNTTGQCPAKDAPVRPQPPVPEILSGSSEAAREPASSRATRTNFEILRPRLALPTILEKGDPLKITLQADTGSVDADEWEVVLTNGYVGYNLPVLAVAYANGQWYLDAITPEFAHEGLYDLSVSSAASTIEASQYNAVMLRETLDKSLTFVQITDSHINQQRNGQFDDSVVYFEQLIEELNLIAPDLLLGTGDLVDANFGGNQTHETLKFLELVRQLEVPFYSLPGNHEYGYPITGALGRGIYDYLDLVNPFLDYSLDAGPFHFIALDSGKWSTLSGDPNGMIPSPTVNTQGFTWDQIDWLQNDLAEHMDSYQRIIAFHAPAITENGLERPMHYLEELLLICNIYNVSMVLTGHTHEDVVFDGNYDKLNGDLSPSQSPRTPLYIQTRSASASSGTKNGYRVIRFEGPTIKSFSYDTDGDGNRSTTVSHPLTLLQCTTEYDLSSSGGGSYGFLPLIVSDQVTSTLAVPSDIVTLTVWLCVSFRASALGNTAELLSWSLTIKGKKPYEPPPDEDRSYDSMITGKIFFSNWVFLLDIALIGLLCGLVVFAVIRYRRARQLK